MIKTLNKEILTKQLLKYNSGHPNNLDDYWYRGKNGLRKSDILYEMNDDEIKDYLECKDDVIKFSKHVKIHTPMGITAIDMMRNQKIIAKHISKRKRVFLTGRRQTGVTTTLMIHFLHKMIFEPDKELLIMTSTKNYSRDIIFKMQKIYQLLPIHIQRGVMAFDKDTIKLDNGSRIKIQSTRNCSIGYTVNYLWLENVDISKRRDICQALIPTIFAQRDSQIISSFSQQGYYYGDSYQWYMKNDFIDVRMERTMKIERVLKLKNL